MAETFHSVVTNCEALRQDITQLTDTRYTLAGDSQKQTRLLNFSTLPHHEVSPSVCRRPSVDPGFVLSKNLRGRCYRIVRPMPGEPGPYADGGLTSVYFTSARDRVDGSDSSSWVAPAF